MILFERVPEAPHALPAAEALALLDVSAATGLGDEEIKRRTRTYGPNTIVSRRRISALAIFAHQFQSPVVYLLAVAAALAFYFGELEEGSAIAAVLAVNALIGFLTELKAMRSIEALRSLGAHSTRVRRDGHTRLIPADEIVPGDIVLVEAGDSISADLRLVEASNLAADELSLTGESVAVDKTAQPVAVDARLAERSSMLLKGTVITRGSGIGVVVAIGLQTEIGQVSQLVEEAEPGSSPLEKKLARLSGQLVWATLILTALIAAIGVTTGENAFLIVEAAIALAVAAIPEGLPIVATLALARGMWRMARQNALIERLSAVETLGATTVILTDKTGTLTENRMTVRRLWIASGEIGLDGAGKVHPATAPQLADDLQVVRLLDVAVLCNDATLGHSTKEFERRSDGTRPVACRPRCRHHAPRARRHASGRAQALLRYGQQDDGDRPPPRQRISVRRQRRAGSCAGNLRTRRHRRRRHRDGRRDAGGMERARRTTRPSRPACAGLRQQEQRARRRRAL